MSCSILIVNNPCNVTNTKCKPCIICHSLWKTLSFIGLQCYNYYHFVSEFSSKFQSYPQPWKFPGAGAWVAVGVGGIAQPGALATPRWAWPPPPPPGGQPRGGIWCKPDRGWGPPVPMCLGLMLCTCEGWQPFRDVGRWSLWMSSLMPRSHKTFHLVPPVKLLGTMLRNKCWSITFSHYYSQRCWRMVPELAGDQPLRTFVYVEGEVLFVRSLANFGCSDCFDCFIWLLLTTNFGFTICKVYLVYDTLLDLKLAVRFCTYRGCILMMQLRHAFSISWSRVIRFPMLPDLLLTLQLHVSCKHCSTSMTKLIGCKQCLRGLFNRSHDTRTTTSKSQHNLSFKATFQICIEILRYWNKFQKLPQWHKIPCSTKYNLHRLLLFNIYYID